MPQIKLEDMDLDLNRIRMIRSILKSSNFDRNSWVNEPYVPKTIEEIYEKSNIDKIHILNREDDPVYYKEELGEDTTQVVLYSKDRMYSAFFIPYRCEKEHYDIIEIFRILRNVFRDYHHKPIARGNGKSVICFNAITRMIATINDSITSRINIGNREMLENDFINAI